MRLVFFGSSKESSEVLNKLLNDDFKVDLVVTQDSKASGRGLRISATPVEKVAKTKNLEVTNGNGLFQEDQIKKLIKRNPDLFVVAAYGKILPKAILKIPRLGTINIHPSMLPLFRGPSPVATAILEGVASTGVTIMLLDEGMDTGPILCQEEIMIEESETCEGLTLRLFTVGGDLIKSAITGLVSRTMKPIPQDDTKATLTTRFTKNDGLINWHSTSIEILRSIRAYYSWPGTFTHYNGKSLKIISAAPWDKHINLRPGEIKMTDEVLIGTSDGAISVKEVQPNGKKIITAGEFKLGYRSLEGSILG